MSEIFLTKVTMANIGLDKNVLKEVVTDKPTTICRVIGRVDNMSPIESQHGTSLKFSGKFEATNALSGEIYQGPNLFVPEVAEAILASQLEQAKEKDEEGSIIFGLDITLVACDTPIGYKYSASPVVKAQQEDPFAEVRKLVTAEPLKIGIEAPKAKAKEK